MNTVVRTCLWFDSRVEEAAKFYSSLVPDSHIRSITHYPPGTPQAGDALAAELVLSGTPYMLLNGGPQFSLNEAVSVVVEADDQAELDRIWDALVADGGAESQCGWCKDRFGLSWQVIPAQLGEWMSGPNAGAVTAAFMQMRKLDIATLEAAAGSAAV